MEIIIVVGRMLAACTCFGVAGLLAYHGKDGWGWLIFAGLLMGMITWTDSHD